MEKLYKDLSEYYAFDPSKYIMCKKNVQTFQGVLKHKNL